MPRVPNLLRESMVSAASRGLHTLFRAHKIPSDLKQLAIDGIPQAELAFHRKHAVVR